MTGSGEREAGRGGAGGLVFGAIRPMLARAVEAPFDDPEWLFEIKWDGYRALAFLERPGGPEQDRSRGRTRLQSRRGRDLSPLFPALLELHERFTGFQAVIDGEIVALRDGRPDFQALQANTGALAYIAFDLLEVDGEVIIDRPLWARRDELSRRTRPGDRLVISSAVAGQGIALHEAAAGSGLEGTVGKRAASRYQPGKRSRDWLKVRNIRRMPALICGYTEAGDARPFGSLILGLPGPDGGLVFAGHVGTGFGQDEMAALLLRLTITDRDPFGARRRAGDGAARGAGEPAALEGPSRGRVVWVKPELVAEVEYLQRTLDGCLRHPVFRGLRPDKEAEDGALPAGDGSGSGATGDGPG